jgi:hypothetical protein
VDRETALAQYCRNWRLVRQDQFDAAEVALIDGLQQEFGEILLDTKEPPTPWAGHDQDRQE